MVARSLLAHRLRHHVASARFIRTVSTAPKPAPKPAPVTGPTTPYSHQKPPPPPQTWLTKVLRENPTAMRAFLRISSLLGYGSKKQLAGRRALAMYELLCTRRADEEKDFWQDECHLPPTFQSWFSVTNLHIWLLTVRLRALPDSLAKHHIQGLIDHFFLDVEERVRAVLQPANPKSPSTTPPPARDTPFTSASANSNFYTIANGNDQKRPKGRAPERLVTRQMKILKEQWAGLGVSMDLGLVRGDAEMAGAVWRNFLGGRGARGIVYPSSPAASGPYFRRSVNLVGGSVESVKKVDKQGLDVEEAKDDGSGVHDYAPAEAGS
ncbi:unnamed protein product [Somion occarium]|uniref:Ubiquinol-cytochrome c chaperone domain-containing protein n=1 Tax=Somion occarium TaxID=3059160 RepID=A0ABP1CVS8_9APHY